MKREWLIMGRKCSFLMYIGVVYQRDRSVRGGGNLKESVNRYCIGISPMRDGAASPASLKPQAGGVGFGELVIGVKDGAASGIRYHGAPAVALAANYSAV